MTEDQFFSAVFLKGMHPESKFRKEVINETTKFIRTSMENEESSFSDEKSMPIFKFIKEKMKVEQENRKFASSQKDKYSEKVKKTYEPQWYKRKENNTENAAIAYSASDGKSNGKLFSNEVMKSERVPFEDTNGKKHTYVATIKQSSICDKCYPDSGVAVNKCKNKCFGEKCHSCGYYGHVANYCMQSVHAITGNKVQH
jgi:hypothetical protein